MKLAFTKKFNKQVAKITSKELADEIIAVITEAESAVTISNISNIKKLSGYKFYYRIRIGDYRIGLFLNGDILEFAAFDHRKDIYKHFP